MDKLKLLLWPFAALYGGVTALRNTAYNKGWFASRKFELPIIAVGNLTVGGTGKTPHVEYLLRLLRNYKVAALSRGYKRTTKGYILADETATAATIGDEPYQYHKDFPDVQVAVSEKRVAGVEQLLQLPMPPEVIVLDDAMQHRAIQPSLNLLLTDYNRLFYKDRILPAGLLRESRKGARRADAVLVTKCPASLHEGEMQHIARMIHTYSRRSAPVFFTGFRYGQFVQVGRPAHIGTHVVLLTGIANPAPLKAHLQKHNFKIHKHLQYPDHYSYKPADLAALKQQLQEYPPETVVLTTRKDAVKLLDAGLQELVSPLPVFSVPIEVYFLEGGDTFNELILQHVRSYYKL
ncbi:tetraacyldisaccharide 4'-kinase [Pontibacter sp. Tf4]|uniref:tetraacyldisaccharide 4'-kinase n=1 Tax=Pontibacter sp. Tf4 TaxID=2761620 RepID=UPI001624E5BA|nr:tetraacyldisaccharide 4'-kinase [Pontibacter sp. Tf4]MBB6610295.1 tetraacyldisaccharide 4'-kinase [Pontibacter sp. Tf4]